MGLWGHILGILFEHFINFCGTFISVYAFTRISIRVYVYYNWKDDILFHFIKEADSLLNYDSTSGLNIALWLYILCAQPGFSPCLLTNSQTIPKSSWSHFWLCGCYISAPWPKSEETCRYRLSLFYAGWPQRQGKFYLLVENYSPIPRGCHFRKAWHQHVVHMCHKLSAILRHKWYAFFSQHLIKMP